jgi:hypothetical protein
MTDPGLNQRLRQRSRRAGFMIGLSMALTIAVCVGGFSFLYAAMDSTFADFITHEVPTAVIPTAPPTQEQVAQQSKPEPTKPANPQAPTPTSTSSTTSQADSTPASGEFKPDYQTTSNAQLNFRSEPSTEGGASTVIELLDFNTPLMFLNKTSPPTTSEDGEAGWMQFRLEDGTEGWLRAIDVETYSP